MINSDFKITKHFISVSLGIIILQLLLSAQLVSAEEPCDDLWYSRNFYFDQAGYCFGSKLGKDIFDNLNCKSKNITLKESVKLRISHIKKVEEWRECNIRTDKVRRLNILNLEMRKHLIDQPINHGEEAVCIGYLGKQKIPLYSAMSFNSEVIGYIKNGDDIYSAHDESTKTEWWFVTSTNKNGQKVIGWTTGVIFDKCKALAG